MITIMYLDRAQARKIVEEKLKTEDVTRADLILENDEFWNTETIWEDGDWIDFEWKCYHCSCWAVPTLVIYYKNGKQKRIPCWTKKAS